MKREEIMTAVGLRMAEIRQVNGYRTDIGTEAIYIQDLDWETDVDAIAYFDDGVDHKEEGGFDEQYMNLRIDAISFVGEGDQGLQGSKMIADIVKAVRKDPTWGRVARRTKLMHDDKIAGTRGTRSIMVSLTWEVLFRTEMIEE